MTIILLYAAISDHLDIIIWKERFCWNI